MMRSALDLEARSVPALLVILATIGGIAVSGCGEDGPSAEDFAKRANAICAGARDEAASIPAPTGLPRVADYAAPMGAVVESMRDELHSLTPPDELAADFDAYDGLLGEQQQALSELSELTAPRERKLGNLRFLDNDAGRLAERLGLADCVAANDAIVARP